MKELSIEEKAKAYDEALERARKFATDLPNGRNDRLYHVWDLESIFPELKVSEDERIRKQLIHYFEYLKPYVPPIKDCFGDEYGYEIPEFIAWLEKQAPSEKAIEYLAKNHSSSEISDFQAAMNIAVAKAYDKGYNDGLEKQGEQDNWAEELNTKIKELHKQCLAKIQEYITPCLGKMSEEDENHIIGITQTIGGAIKHNVISHKTGDMQITWLKSLKNRVIPQPKQEWSEHKKLIKK